MRYRFIDTHKKVWPINLMCGVLDVSRSGFYHWQGRGAEPASVFEQGAGQSHTRAICTAQATLRSTPDNRRSAR